MNNNGVVDAGEPQTVIMEGALALPAGTRQLGAAYIVPASLEDFSRVRKGAVGWEGGSGLRQTD